MKIDLNRLILFFVIMSLAILLFLNRESVNKENLDALLLQFGIWTPLAFIILYALALVLFFPATIFTLLGGFVFGPFWGTVYSVMGCTIGSTLAFLVARYLARDWVDANSHTLVEDIKAKVDKQGWRVVAIARLLPISPFSLLNSVFGLTRISAVTYTVTSFISMIPLIAFYVYLGSLGQGLID